MREKALILLALLLASCAGEKSDRVSDIAFSLRGHPELGEPSPGSYLPRYFVPEVEVDACFTAPSEVDTTLWAARIKIGFQKYSQIATDRMGRTVCFAVPLDRTSLRGRRRLRIDLVDEFDGRVVRTVDQPIELLVKPREYRRLLDRLDFLLSSHPDQEAMFSILAEIESDAQSAGYPFLAARVRMIHAYYLRSAGSADTLARARALLGSAPAWLANPHADVWAAQQHYEQASLALELNEPRSSIWQLLSSAEDRYLEIADKRRITVVMKQADLLARSGSTETGRARLQAALEECREPSCEPRFKRAARNTLAWLALQDPQTPGLELLNLQKMLAAPPEDDARGVGRLEEANRLTNLALVAARLGVDPSVQTDQLRSTLSRSEQSIDKARGRWLAAWGDIARAEYRLHLERPQEAIEICESVWDDAATPDLAAHARSCMARAYVMQGETERAYEEIQNAMVMAEAPVGERHAWVSPVSDAKWSHDLKFAARLAIQLKRPWEAWRWLESLDLKQQPAEDVCPATDTSSQDLAAAIEELAELAGPASRDRQRQRDQIRPRILLRAQQALRDRLACVTSESGRERLDQITQRAFIYRDEVVLLSRKSGSRIVEARVTEFESGGIEARLDEMSQELQRRELSAEEWRTLMLPLAAALLPSELGDERRFSYALHGQLQRVPLAALPLDASREYFADRSLIVRIPTLASSPRSRPSRVGAETAPLFLVDPLGNLAGSNEWAAEYREAFPEALILAGQSATAASVSAALPKAAWLHVDAHGLFDPVFPELSQVRLADGETSLLSWADQVSNLEFANLSMCASGSWPVRAQSGRFGVAGMFAEASARYVIGARADLPNEVAGQFNLEFYRAFAADGEFEKAYKTAFSAVRRQFGPTEWAPLLLLVSPEPKKGTEKTSLGGQSAHSQTLTHLRRETSSSSASHSGEH